MPTLHDVRSRRPRTRLCTAVPMIAFALCLAACGGGDTAPAASAPIAAASLTPAAADGKDATAAAPDMSAALAGKVEKQPIRNSVGVQVQPWYVQSGDLERIEAAGFGVVRWGLSWQQIETSPGVYDWSQSDRFVERLRQTGLRSIIILGFGNAIYSGSASVAPDPAARDATSPVPPGTPEARAAFARFAGEAARRYADMPISWEIWNEPDSSVFWPVSPDFQAYAALANEACRAIKKSAPKAVVVGGAGAALPNAVMEQSGNLYQTLVGSDAARCIDAISGHGYRMGANYNSPDPDSIDSDLGATDRYLYGSLGVPAKMPFYMTEWGFPSSLVDPNLQIAYVMRGTLTNLAHQVGLTVWYEWRDSRLEEENHEAHFGLLTMYGDAKASPAALAGLAWLAHASFAAPLNVSRAEVGAALVTSGSSNYAVLWLKTADQSRSMNAYVDGVYAGKVSYFPQAFPVKSSATPITFSD